MPTSLQLTDHIRIEERFVLIDTRFNDLTELMLENFDRLDARCDALERRMGIIEERMTSIEVRMDKLEARMGTLEKKVDDILAILMEMRSKHA